MVRRGFWMTVSVVCLALAVWFGTKSLVPDARVLASPRQPLVLPPSVPANGEARPSMGEEDRPHTFRIPSGSAASLSCEDARTVVAQVRRKLAYVADPLEPAAYATATSDWLDPHGLWSVSPDAPVFAALEKVAPQMLTELEARGVSDCGAARTAGRSLAAWVRELRGIFDEHRAHVGAATDEQARVAASDAPFEGAQVHRPARVLAGLLGDRVGIVERAFGAGAASYASAARRRFFPELDDAGWARVVLAASVRAYVQIVDPHGQWAPLDEEVSVYDVELEAHPPSRLWEKALRTALGVRIDSGAAAPLRDGDVVLSLAELETAGLSQEQVEQLGFAAAEIKGATHGVVLRAGEPRPVVVYLGSTPPEAKASGAPAPEESSAERIAYGGGDVVVVAIKDVRDDLGDALTRTLLRERERPVSAPGEKSAVRPLVGVVLDLRGNGGGSTDGAYEALGIFLPGAPLFPMKRRDGIVEPDRAPAPPSVDRWTGPVATLVDGDTASAAEMIAGALTSYRRGPSVGAQTFGKGCAQEYDDDDAHAGVLRLTTLLYALPDGAPVQRVGLVPTYRLPFSAAPLPNAREREAALLHAPPSWRGPDVRDRALVAKGDEPWSAPWPSHGGEIGPCKDGDVCRALKVLGGTASGPRRIAKGAVGGAR